MGRIYDYKVNYSSYLILRQERREQQLKQFEEQRRGRTFELQLKRTERISRISGSFTEVREGDVFCRFNSAGALEVGIRNGDASRLLGIRLGSINNEIKLVFQ